MFLSKSSRKYSLQCRAFPGEHISATLPVDGTTCCKLHDMMMLVCQSLRVMITASTPSRQHSMLPQHRGNNQWPLLQLQHCRSRELSSSCKSAECATRHANTQRFCTRAAAHCRTHTHTGCAAAGSSKNGTASNQQYANAVRKLLGVCIGLCFPSLLHAPTHVTQGRCYRPSYNRLPQ